MNELRVGDIVEITEPGDFQDYWAKVEELRDEFIIVSIPYIVHKSKLEFLYHREDDDDEGV